MTAATAPGRQDRLSTILGWAMFAGFTILLFNILALPRTALDEREGLRAFHDSVGLLVVVLAIWQLIRMRRSPALLPPPGLPVNSFAFNRALLATLYLVFALEGVIGLVYAWGEFDREVVLFGLHVPGLVADSDNVRKFFGYMHSAFGFYYIFLLVIWLLFGLYQHLRYKAGLLRLLPGARV